MLRPTSSHGPCLGVLNRHPGRGFSMCAYGWVEALAEVRLSVPRALILAT